MDAHLKEIEDTKRDNDFRLISDELKRQFDLQMRVDDSHNVKSGIILGFIMVVIVQITLTPLYIDVTTAKPLTFISFAIGFLAIICSFCLGIIAVYPKDYDFGSKIPKLTKQWKDKVQKDYAESIFGMMWRAYKNDREIIEVRAKLVKGMLWAFSIGLIFIILSRIAPW